MFFVSQSSMNNEATDRRQSTITTTTTTIHYDGRIGCFVVLEKVLRNSLLAIIVI